MATKRKRQKIFQWYYSKNFDIIFTQETHSSLETETDWKDEWDGDIFFSHGTSSARGTCIFIRSRVQKEIHKIIKDDDGRYIILDITLDGVRVTLASVYAPNDDDPDYIINIRNLIEDLTNDERLIGGDYNLVLDLKIDKKGGVFKTNSKAQQKLLEYMRSTNLIDVWRAMHPNESKFTWSRSKPTKIFCRLDFFLASESFFNRIKSSEIIPGFISDHSAVTLTIETNKTPRGKGYWKMNCSHFKNQDYVDLIKKTIRETAEINKEANPNLLWDTIKTAIRGESIKYGASKKKIIDNEMIQLERDIQNFEEKSTTTTLTPEEEQLLSSKKCKLDQIMNVKAEGAYIRSRSQNYEEGERNSKYFFNIEKKNSYKKAINKLKMSDNSITENQETILEEMKSFYKNLYSKQALEDGDNFLNKLSIPEPLPTESEDKLKAELEPDELSKAVKLMQPNKSPGEDGLPIEFYRFFWNDIKSYLFASHKYSLESGSLSITQKRGVISLLPKKNDLLLLKNWRPLTLLNVDYKILAKIIATRIKEALILFINNDQTGFLQKRFIGQNIASLIEIIEYCDYNDLAAVLISIDFEKAFDKIDWDFLWKCMAFFNIPQNIITWVKILYSGACSCVTNNGHMSNYFNLGRGVRQGCPLSPYLFIIAAEILAISIRENPQIKGIKIGEKEYKIKQFADDSQAISIFDQDSINATIKNFLDYGKVSGQTINYDKSADIMRIGSIKNTQITHDLNHNVYWTNGPIEVLGIFLSPDITECTQLNYSKVTEKIEESIQLWSSQKLTLFGKISIINTVLISKLVFRLSCLPSPQSNTIETIESKLLDFLWSSKRHSISKQMITNSRNNFGLKFPSLVLKDRSLKLAWIKRMVDSGMSETSPFLYHNIKIDPHLLFQCNIKVEDLGFIWQNKPSSFWIDVLKAWCTSNYRTPNNIEKPDEEIIWLNSNIKVNRNPIFYRNMFSKGIIQVKDLKENGIILSFDQFTQKHPEIRSNFIEYFGIINALPYNYKLNLPGDSPKKSALEVYLTVQKVPKKFYNHSLENMNSFPTRALERHSRHLQNLTKFSGGEHIQQFTQMKHPQ